MHHHTPFGAHNINADAFMDVIERDERQALMADLDAVLDLDDNAVLAWHDHAARMVHRLEDYAAENVARNGYADLIQLDTRVSVSTSMSSRGKLALDAYTLTLTLTATGKAGQHMAFACEVMLHNGDESTAIATIVGDFMHSLHRAVMRGAA